MQPETREVRHYHSANVPYPLNKQIMKTSGLVQDDILRSFQHYSEIGDLRDDILRQHSHQDLTSSSQRFQAYVRQGVTFYVAADNAHYRASPLLYYYSFLNFAKAIVFLHDPTFQSDGIRHGLTPLPGSGDFRGHSIEVRNGVFPYFYKRMLGADIGTKTELRVLDLLSYVSDLSYEHRVFNRGNSNSCPCKYAVVLYHGEQRYRGLIAVGVLGASRTAISDIMSPHFAEIKLAKASAREVFDILSEEMAGFTFWETIKPYDIPNDVNPPEHSLDCILGDMINALGSHFSQNPFADSFLFKINLKIMGRNSLFMNEAVAIYALMFYFGSLVRYRPEVLEEMLTWKEAQVIEGFVKSTPLTFLRYTRNLLDGNYFVYKQR